MMLRSGDVVGGEEPDMMQEPRAAGTNPVHPETSNGGENPDKPMSITSTMSKADSIRQRNLEAELAAEELLFAREKALILKRLEIQKLKILEEENSDQLSQCLSNHENDIPISIASEKTRTQEWVTKSEDNKKETEANELVQSMINAFRSLSNQQTQEDSNLMGKFVSQHASGRELPTFSGDPEEWPGFFSVFGQSTAMCGYTPDENMLRLQRCLKGRAKESVKSLLHLPNQIDNVMKTLLTSFGRPAAIVKSMIARAKLLPSPKEDKSESIIDFSNAVKNLVATMETLGCLGHMWNPQLVEDFLLKLPTSLRMQWGHAAATIGQTEPNLKDFSLWLEDLAVAASYLPMQSIPKDPVREKYELKIRNFQPTPRHAVLTTGHERVRVCKYCEKEGHSIHTCDSFTSQDTETKRTWVRENNLCFACLKSGHMKKDCRKKRPCGIQSCQTFHHKLLHDNRSEDKTGHVFWQSSLTAPLLGGKTRDVVALLASKAPPVLLRLLPITVMGPKGKVATCALFDEGSTVTLMDWQLAKEISASGKRNPLQLRWTNNSCQTEKDSMSVNVSLQGNSEGCEVYPVQNVRTVKNLSLPVHSIDVQHLQEKWTHLKTVPISSMTNAKPKMLIGQDNCQLIIPREVIEGPPNAPVLSRSLLGWSVHGTIGCQKHRIDEEFILHAWDSGNVPQSPHP